MEEKTALIVECEDGREMKFAGATNTSLVDGALHVILTTKTPRIEPVSVLWGLYKSERRVVDTENRLLAVFAKGMWVNACADGSRVTYSSITPCPVPEPAVDHAVAASGI